MSSSAIFLGAGFYVAGATQFTPGTVRLTYSTAPKASSPAGVDDALNPANYALSGPGPYLLMGVASVSGDPLSFDLILTTPLAIGTWTAAVSNVKTPANNVLTAPTAAVFTVTSNAQVTSLSAGTENDDAEKVIRKHLSPALKGPNWDALIAGLATGDDRNWDNARSAFDQLFITSASGSWLATRASDEGVTKPTNVGISDDLFRKLTIKTSANKVVHEAVREILEVYYGQDSIRAFVEAEIDENYNLTGEPDLSWILDEKESFTHTFQSAQFSSVGASKAVEVAFALTKTMRDLGSKGFAIAFTSPETGRARVRIYSGSLGLGSFVRVTGGSAQNLFHFPKILDTYSGTVTVPTGYTWVFSRPDQNTTRVSLTINTSTTSRLLDLSIVREGDYVLVGPLAQIGITGTFPIKAVGISWSGTLLTQTFDIDQISFTTTAIQAGNAGYQFYRPSKSTINAAGGRTVVVAQTRGGHVDISIPATTQAVNRGPKTAAYGRVNDSLAVARLQRLPGGTATITTLAAHDLLVGQQVLLDSIRPASSRPFITPGNGATFPSSFTYPASHLSVSALTQTPPSPTTENGTATRLSNGQILFAGGYRTLAGAYDASKVHCNRYAQGSTATIIDATEADGATAHSHTWVTTADLNGHRQYHAASSYGTGAMVTGGLRLSPYTILATTEQYVLNGVWVNTASMAQARSGHAQVELNNNTIIVIGGAINESNATPTTEIFNGTAWSAGSPMINARTDFQASKLSDGRILVTGGRSLGQGQQLDSNVLALWRLDESAGPTAAEATGTYPLTHTGTTLVTVGKIGNGVDFNGSGSYLSGAGNAGAVTALLGQWTAEMWFRRTTTGAGQLLTYGGTAATLADNVLLGIGIDVTQRVYWKWDFGAGVPVTQTMTLALPSVPSYRVNFFNHLAVRKTFNGTNYDVSVFINGILAQTWTGQANAAGGTTALWYVARNPELVGGFPGVLDDIRVSKTSRTDAEIYTDFLLGYGNHQSPSGEIAIGTVLQECEIYNGTWTRTGAMSVSRCFHRATVLPGDFVLVTGGLGYDTSLIGEAASLRAAEMWDPTTGRWQTLQSSGVRRHWHQTAFIAARNQVVIEGGLSSQGDNATIVETLDLVSRTWKTSPANMQVAGRSFGSRTTDGLEIVTMGTNDGTVTTPTAQTYISGGLLVSGGGLNAQHRVSAVLSPTRFQIQTPGVPDQAQYTSTLGATYQGQTATGGFWALASGSRTSGVTTLTMSFPAGTTAHGIGLGELVYVNSRTGAFGAGLYTVTAVTDTTISYLETGSDQGSISVTGSVSENQSPDGVETRVTADPQTINDPGPYTFDPVDGVSVTSTESETTGFPLYANQRYEEVELVNGDSFPDASGYIVFGFGTDNQSSIIKYLGKYKSGATTTRLILDYSHKFTRNYPVGSKVTLLSQREAFVPEDPLIGGAWITASSAGRVAAQAGTEAALAAGINPDITIVYPGDRGLGGEGLPSHGTQKLSDKVAVFAGDSVSEDVETARES